MGKHAQPRQPSRARRTAVVSTGTLLLCLGSAAPALADIGPIPVPDPVSSRVDQGSHATGLPNPLHTVSHAVGSSDKTTKPAKHHHKHAKHHARTPLPTSTLSTTHTSSSPAVHTAARHRHQATAVIPASYTYGGLRGV